MEKLFELERSKFILEVTFAIPGFKEEHKTKDGICLLDIEKFDDALIVLDGLYKYVSNLPETVRNVRFVLGQILHIARTGEIMYLYEYCGYDDEDLKVNKKFIEKIKNKKAYDELHLAARWLEYCARVYEGENISGEEIQQIEDILMEFEDLLFEEFDLGFEKFQKEQEIPFPVRLFDYIEEHVIGQPELKLLALAIHRFVNLGMRENSVTLLKGPTGCGKNYVMQMLEECTFMPKNVVFMQWDISKNTPEGFTGRSSADIIKKYKQRCIAKKQNPLTCKGIIYLNEADKIFMPNTDSNGENSNAFVQQQLLTMIEGAEVIEGVDTKNLMFVFGGAFGSVDKLEEERKQKSNIGFGRGEAKVSELARKTTLREDIISLGAERELIGRISTIVTMRKLDKEDIKKILMHPEKGVIKKKQEEFKKSGLEVIFSDEVIDQIAEECLRENLGARSGQNIVNEITDKYQMEMFREGYDTLIVHEGMIVSEEPPRYERRS